MKSHWTDELSFIKIGFFFLFFIEEQWGKVHDGNNISIGFGIFNLIIMVKNCCFTLLSSFHSFNETTAAAPLFEQDQQSQFDQATV